MSERENTLGFMASEGSRNGEKVVNFVKNNLTRLKKYKIVSTEGTHNDLLSMFKDDLTLECLRPGYCGGVIELATKIVNNECKTMIFFSDQNDRWANSYENLTLIRQCIVHDTDLIQNLWGATIWAENSNRCIDMPFNKQTVALISHNAKKEKMLEYVGNNLESLNKFGRIITTGTTGSLIKKLFPIISDKVFPMESGPKGGDVQIANEIIENRCQHAIFFMDPDNPHPHTSDIQLFSSVCQQIDDVNVNFLVTEKSAKRWIESTQTDINNASLEI